MSSPIPVFLALGCAMAATAAAQVQGVVTGYAIDARAGTLRPILGLPGASRLGGPLPLAISIAGGEVRHGRAVLIGSEPRTGANLLQPVGLVRDRLLPVGSVYLVQNLAAASPEAIALTSAIGSVNRVFLSAGGTAALLYSERARTFQIVTGLDSNPSVSDSFSSGILNGSFSAAAVSNAGCALLASADDSNAYVSQVCAAAISSPRLAGQVPGGRIASLAFMHQDHDAVIADRGGNQVLLLPNVGNGWTPQLLAGAAAGISAPASVLPLDDSRIALIQAGSAQVLALDASNPLAQPQSFPLPLIPVFLDPLDASGVMACTPLTPGPMLLIDTAHDFASFFVPMN